MGLGAQLISYLLSVTVVLSNIVSGKQHEHLDEKPVPIKTIKTEYGDIYDCIDFYKQPAFNHRALKNHNFHPGMRPNSGPKSSMYTNPNNAKNVTSQLKVIVSCPYGTVPIRRPTININPSNNSRILQEMKDGTYVAIAQSKSPHIYYGVGADLTVHEPAVGNDEYSSGRIAIKAGPDTIQAGWTVNPIFYKDTQVRMFIYTEANGTSCYSTDCSGFVILRSDIPVDSVVTPFIQPRGPNSYLHLNIYQDLAAEEQKDQKFGNWWLVVGPQSTAIGFWPRNIFTPTTGLAEVGTHVECGGEVYHDVTKVGAAPMGHGFRPSNQEQWNAYCFNFIVVNETHMTDIAMDTDAYSSIPDWYGVVDKYIPVPKQIGFDVSHNNNNNGSDIVIVLEHIVIYGGTQNYSLIM